MSFKAAVQAAPAPVNDAWQPGKRALSNVHRSRVECADPQRITGSIALDAVLARDADHANAQRWDYGLGYRPRNGNERAIWVEVHPASTSNVSEVIAKLRWLRAWLRDEAHNLDSLTVADEDGLPFVWIATAGVHIVPNSPQARKLSSEGIHRPQKALRLP